MEPIFDPTTERVYQQLPYHYRVRDEVSGWPLKRFLSGMLINQDDVTTLVDRLTYTPPDAGGVVGDTSDLVDPKTADLEWLGWLGQLFGTQVKGSITEETRETIIKASGFRAGTMDSMVAAAQKVLVGSKKVRIIPHADESWQPDMNEKVYRTNLASIGSFESVASAATGGSATVTLDSSWHLSGSHSCKVVSTGNNASAAYLCNTIRTGNWWINFVPGQTYTVSGTIHIPAAQNTTGITTHPRSIIIGYRSTNDAINYTIASSDAAPNTPGDYRLSVTFVAPADADTCFVRLMNGSATAGDTVNWDNVMVEQTDVLGDYFDGSVGDDGGYSVRWLGDPYQSPSQVYIPAISNTAGPWDMLVMTLQSETLKNLLQPSLAQTLTPSVWQCDYQSYGYDPNYVWKTLATQNDVYQNRAFSFALRDTTWQASVQSTTGFGTGPFGVGAFGLGTDTTSKLRLLSNTGFDVTPGDSYQYLVSLGLQQDVADEKRSAIGFQFYDADGNVINDVVATNLFPDPGFEYGTAGMTASTGSTLTQDTTRHHSGAYSLQVTTTTASTSYEARLGFAATAGETYTFSAWQYVPTGTTRGRNIAMGQGVAAAISYNTDPVVNDDWQYVTVSNTAASTGTMYVHIYAGDVANQPVWYDDMGLTVGTTPVDFNGDTPAPVVGTNSYSWSGTPGSSATNMLDDVYSTPISVTPNIINNSVVSHNMIKSTKARNYAPYAIDTSTVLVSNYGKYEGGNVLRGQVNNTSPTTEVGIYATPNAGMGTLSEGTAFTFSLDVNLSSDLNSNELRVFFRDDVNGDNDAVSFKATTPAAVPFPTKGRWHRYAWTATVNPGRTISSAYIVVEGTSAQPSGATLDTANWLLEEGTTVNPFFNGDSPDYNQYRFQWDGVEEASITNKVLISVAEANKVTMEQLNTRFLAPPDADSAKVFIDMDGFNGKDTLLVAQPASREEYDETWVPVTADPLQSIVDNSAKPAGVILHYQPIVATWDTITAEGTRPWSELDGLTWVQMEELT